MTDDESKKSAPRSLIVVTLRALEVEVAAVLLVAGALVIWGAAEMPSGTARLPGPGFLPMSLGALLMAAALAVIVMSVRADHEHDVALKLGNAHIALTVAAVIAAGLLFEEIGFIATSTLFLFVLLRALSPLGWWRSAIASIAAAIVTKFVFQDVLSVTLPPFAFTLF